MRTIKSKRRKRMRDLADAARIKVLVTKNPCRPKTVAVEMYALLLRSNGKTVGEYKACVRAAKLTGNPSPIGYLRDQLERKHAEVRS